MALLNETIQPFALAKAANLFQAAATLLDDFSDAVYGLSICRCRATVNSTVKTAGTAGIVGIYVGTTTQMNGGTGTLIAKITIPDTSVKGVPIEGEFEATAYAGYRVAPGSCVYAAVHTKALDTSHSESVCNVDVYVDFAIGDTTVIAK